MNHEFIADRIEVRSLTENNKPRYMVRGTAIIPNKKHIYEYVKNKDGSIKTLKSMFTQHCIESIKEQAKHRSLFIDTQHELARDASIKSIIKGKVRPEEEKQISNMLDRKKLPLAKINDIDIKDERLDIETELNPMFREVDDDHKNYFDAVWYSLQNKYLNGISVTFGDYKYATDEQGDMVIDDVDVLGFSYLDSPADTGNSIYEVAIRAIEEGINMRSGEKMEEEAMKKIEAEKVKLADEKKKIEEERSVLQKQKEEVQKQVEIAKQAEEQKKMQDELQKKTDEAKKAQDDAKKAQDELNSIKGQTKPQDKYGQQGQKATPEFYKEKLKEITKEHDETVATLKSGKQPMIDKRMAGFAELVHLQAKANNPTADLDEENAAYVRQNRLLDRSRVDIVTPKLAGE